MLQPGFVRAIFEKESVRSLSNGQKAFLGYYVVMALGMLSFALILAITGKDHAFILGVLGFIHAGLFVGFLLDARNDRNCASMMLKALADGGKQLAWVYREEVDTLQGTRQQTNLHFCFTNRRRGYISGPDNLITDLETYFAGTFQDIRTGYNPQFEEEFQRFPANFKKNPQRTYGAKHTTVDYSQANGW